MARSLIAAVNVRRTFGFGSELGAGGGTAWMQPASAASGAEASAASGAPASVASLARCVGNATSHASARASAEDTTPVRKRRRPTPRSYTLAATRLDALEVAASDPGGRRRANDV